MKILSNATYHAMLDQLKYMSESNVKLNCDIERLKSELKTFQQERLRLNLTRDEKGVLHRITETKTSRINRKTKANDTVRYSSEYFSDPVDVTKSAEHANEPKPKKFEPKEGEIVCLNANTYYDDGRMYVVYFEKNATSVMGIGDDGEFASIGVQARDTFSPATEEEKAMLRKLDPQSEQNLWKMIDSKSSKELAEEYLGLKVGDGYICGYGYDSVIIGYDKFGMDMMWPYECLGSDDCILKKHKFYLYQTKAAKASILKSLNPR